MLESFLNTKPLYYNEIDYERMPRVYATIKKNLKLPKIIHIIGTNGKGTTGRFLATALYSLGFVVGHYTSPHIKKFNERIWLNGSNVEDVTLSSAHTQLLSFLTKEDADSLSYFEYTTLLALLVYQECEYVVLEAGLGGEHDATAVFENILTLITPIGIDHEAFLGNTIEKIATTKLSAIQKHAIVGKQIESDVYKVADKIAKEKHVEIKTYAEFLNNSDVEKIKKITSKLNLAEYLQENLSLSIAALKFLNIAYEVENFQEAKLFGRLTQFRENIIVDVGHNALAAQRVYESLKGNKYILVYNSYKDKDYKKILKILQPLISHVEIIKVEDARIESQNKLEEVMQNLGIDYRDFVTIQRQEKYLVFGSFSVLEKFLKVVDE